MLTHSQPGAQKEKHQAFFRPSLESVCVGLLRIRPPPVSFPNADQTWQSEKRLKNQKPRRFNKNGLYPHFSTPPGASSRGPNCNSSREAKIVSHRTEPGTLTPIELLRFAARIEAAA